MKLLLPIALIFVMSAPAQRGGMGGGMRGGMGASGMRGGMAGGGFRGGAGGPGIGRGFAGGVNRGGFGGINRGGVGLGGFNKGFTAPALHPGFNRFGGFGRVGSFGLGLGLGWGGWGWGWGVGSYGCPYSYPCTSYVTYPYVGGYWPGYSTVPAIDYNYGYTAPQSPVTIVYAQPGPVERATPVLREYDDTGREVRQPSSAAASPIYLFAFQDGVIRAASAYEVKGTTLHYVTLEREEKQVPLDTLDRALTLQLNRERRVVVQIP
jgi:hypothetical protein